VPGIFSKKASITNFGVSSVPPMIFTAMIPRSSVATPSSFSVSAAVSAGIGESRMSVGLASMGVGVGTTVGVGVGEGVGVGDGVGVGVGEGVGEGVGVVVGFGVGVTVGLGVGVRVGFGVGVGWDVRAMMAISFGASREIVRISGSRLKST